MRRLINTLTTVSLILILTASDIYSQARSAGSNDSYEASLRVDTSIITQQISPLLYGNNVKWLFNGESGFSRDNGIWNIRHDSINPHALDLLKKSGITILRYGDGTNSSYFYWGWSIPTLKKRLSRDVQTRWGSKENYVFGLMEFISLCETIGCKSNIIINYGMGLLTSYYDPAKHDDSRSQDEIAYQQAVNLVEFLNAPAPIQSLESYPKQYSPEFSLKSMPKGYFAYLRKSLGHPEPVGVEYWEIGNEIYGFHASGGNSASKQDGQIQKIPVKEYTFNAIQFAKKMKSVDPSIQVGLVEYPGDLKRQLSILELHPDAIDFIIAHDYIEGNRKGNEGTYTFYGAGKTSSMHREISVIKGGTYFLEIQAWGRAYFGDEHIHESGVFPKLEIRVNGKQTEEITISHNVDVNSKTVSHAFNVYRLRVELAPGTNTFDMRLSNDFLDKNSSDIDRRGRDIFINGIRVSGHQINQEILWPSSLHPIYSQLHLFSEKTQTRSDLMNRYAPQLFIAQTESAVYPNFGDLGAALVETCMLMDSMDHGVKIRNFWHLYGPCDRMGSIHSGTKKKDHYHATPQYLVLKLFSEVWGNHLIHCRVNAPMLNDKMLARSDLMEKTQSQNNFIPSLMARASLDKDRLCIAFVNLDLTKNALVKLSIDGFTPSKFKLHIIASRSADIALATNENIKDNVRLLTTDQIVFSDNISLPPGSISIMEMQHQ